MCSVVEIIFIVVVFLVYQYWCTNMKLILHLSLFPLKITDLFDRIVDGGVKLDEVRASEILGSLLDAIAYLHERQIVHRDLKVSSRYP